MDSRNANPYSNAWYAIMVRYGTMKTGVLLINLGTPDAATVPAVRRYLREFLSDPYVIDIPALARWVLLHAVILPFRTKQTTNAYQQIWTEQGSPLLINSNAFAKKLQQALGKEYCVALAMRYGNPNIKSAVNKLLSQDISNITIIPLYPQYAESTTKSSIQKAEAIIRQHNETIAIISWHDFYQDDYYIHAKAERIKKTIKNKKFETLIFSYHGLPERHIHRVCHETKTCNYKRLGPLGPSCPNIKSNNHQCYRAQCYETSRLLAKQLGLQSNEYRVSFQSRLGRTPWVTPYTDHVLEQLAKEGVKHIAIVCPSFVADCLETLEEIDIRLRAQWQALGGDTLVRIPCLNDDASWADGLANEIHLIYSKPQISQWRISHDEGSKGD